MTGPQVPRPASATASPDAVRVWTEPMTLPTYAVQEDPVPRFEVTDDENFYPYSAQVDISPKAADRTWTAVCMENRYLMVVILPELGGRVFAIYDKLAEADVVYRQKSIKPAKAATRGAWTSGGIEFNFPHSHSVTTHDKIHWTTSQSSDGSAAVLIGDVERISRMAWTVELRLYPHRACLEDRIILHNRTPMRQRYYYWTNAGIEASDQTQLIYPFPKVTGHYGGNYDDWPIRDGIDWTWYRQHTEATSLFAVGGQEAFIGAYDHGRGVGVAQYSERSQLLGRKFWSWGTSPAAQRWYEVLSDDKRPYLELQSGPLLTQSDYAWMPPYEEQRFEEYWIPVSRIGPFVRANPQAVVRLTVENDTATVGVLPVQKFPSAQVELRRGGELLQTWKADLSPEQPLLQTVKVQPTDASKLRLTVRDARGQVVIEHTYGKYALDGPLPTERANSPGSRPGRGDPTPAEAARRYEQQWLNREYADAARTIEEALSKWPDDPQVRYNGARFRLWQGRFAEAAKMLEPLSARSDDAEMRYYLALANWGMGDTRAALELLAGIQGHEPKSDATLRPAPGPAWVLKAAAILRAKVLMSEGKFAVASGVLEPFRKAQPQYTYAAALYACAARRQGHLPRPNRTFLQGPDLEPMARLEAQSLTGKSDSTLQRMLLRDPDAAVELACDYIGVADWSTAEKVLTGVCGRIAESGMTWLMAGYCAAMQGNQAKAAEYWAKAEAAPVERVFPSRVEELAAAELAMQRVPGAARAAYYSGLTLMRLMRYDEAMTRWQQAIAVRDDNALAHRCLASALAAINNNRQEAVVHLEKAIRLMPNQPAFYLDLAAMYSAMNRLADARDVLERAVRNVPATDSMVTDLAATYLALGQYRQAARTLAAHKFNVAEGRYGLHDNYAVAWLGSGLEALLANRPAEALAAFDKALEYPENLSIGRPADPQNESMIHFWRGVALQQLGKPDLAEQAFEQAVRQAAGERVMRRSSFYGAINVAHGAIALTRLGRTQQFAVQVERLKDPPSRSRRSDQQFERLRMSTTFRTAWAQALQSDGSVQVSVLQGLKDDPQVPAQWSRLSILAAETLQRHVQPAGAATQEASAR